jgi:hypothetical protein
MKTANEMRATAVKAIETANEIKRKKAIEYVENEIAPEIERVANCGGFMKNHRVDANIDMETVIEVLLSHGYVVCSSCHDIRIQWHH